MINATFQLVRSPAEVAEVARLADEIWRDHYTPIIGRAQVDYMLDQFQSPPAISDQIARACEYYLIENSAQNVGYLAVTPDPAEHTLFLSKIYVRKSTQGAGFGKQALVFAENICRERSLKLLWLTVNKHNHHSIAWYLRMGFQNTGSLVQDIGGGFLMDDFRMEKVIA